MQDQNLLYQIALTLARGIGDIIAKQLIQSVDHIEILFTEKKRLLERLPGITPRLADSLKDPEILLRAEREINFIQKNRIQTLFVSDEAYPKRMKECIDSPILLYYKGDNCLNSSKIISIVGTRHATEYGKETVDQITAELAATYPDLLVVSGLAYGIDIAAHKAALKSGLKTVAVLAHGLDRIYPSQHRNIALNMLQNGGLLTDFISETNPDRQNFVKRNRIVAGISDCTLVIESADKGGALITAEIAFSYGKDVLSVPGKITSAYSRGCNKLIKENKAALVESAEDIIRTLCWNESGTHNSCANLQMSIFPDLTEEEQQIYDILTCEDLQLNLLTIRTDKPVNRLTPLLFEMEMKGIIECVPGGIYRLNKQRV